MRIAVIGGGPAGLRAAEVAAAGGARVTLFDAKASPGRKFLVAGRGGLNLTNTEPPEQFAARFDSSGRETAIWPSLIAGFDCDAVRAWAAGLGVETFAASTGRVFPRGLKAAPLLRAWIRRLRDLGVEFKPHHRWISLEPDAPIRLGFNVKGEARVFETDAAVLALGGGSWPGTGSDGAWTSTLERLGVSLAPLQPANCGWEVAWPPQVLAAAEGRPLKNLVVRAAAMQAAGELLVTGYGLEGGALYHLGPALRAMPRPELSIDFKPDITAERLLSKLAPQAGNPVDQARLRWNLTGAAWAILLMEPAPLTAEELAARVKNCPIRLIRAAPLARAISTAGGICWAGLDDDLMLKNLPGVFAAGEMIDWEAPTGGYLIHGCLATGTRAGEGALRWLGRASPPDPNAEWLETDGLGGFSCGTVSGIRTRRYHALLLCATTPPSGRMVLVNGLDARVETPDGIHPISSQRYAPDVIAPDGATRIESFESEPHPRWRYRLDAARCVDFELFIVHGGAQVVLSWRLIGEGPAKLSVRLFFSGRDFHSLHHENPSFRFLPEQAPGRWTWRPYDGIPGVVVLTDAAYVHDPQWYRNFLYTEEQARGLDCTEDLAAPGVFEFDLSIRPATLILAAEGWQSGDTAPPAPFPTPLDRAADAYLARRGDGATLLAGFPWFGDWGRDTFIAIRGLCIATGRLAQARAILLQWAGVVSRGMLPNRFPDLDAEPEFNSVDASLWFIIAAGDYLAADDTAADLRAAIEAILAGYAAGTRFNIHACPDGLLAAGEPGWQLTWMDARADGREVTPRIGKPVEVQALWLNALAIAARFSPRWNALFETGRAAFQTRFWDETAGHLADVVDCDHHPGAVDLTFRPNRILAVGGLPLNLLSDEKARRVVDAVEARLLTPLGLRTLAPGEPGYSPRYVGGPAERDAAYHQGTVWPWLIGPFVEAWVRVRGNTPAARAEARARFLPPLREHLKHAGLGHISEIADGDPPHTPRGCPFQAWSLGEFLRLERSVLAEPPPSAPSLPRVIESNTT